MMSLKSISIFSSPAKTQLVSTLLGALVILTLSGATLAQQQDSSKLGFPDWVTLTNDVVDAAPVTGFDMDLDETYGVNGYLEDADLRATPGEYDLDSRENPWNTGLKSTSSAARKTAPRKHKKQVDALVQELASQKEKDLPIFGMELFARSQIGGMTNTMTLPTRDLDYILKSGDTVRIHLFDGDEVDEQRLAVIDPDGSVDLKELGPVLLGGISVSDARTLVAEHVAERYLKINVTLRVEDRRPVKVVVAGSARRQGVYQLPPGATLLTALLACGGPSEAGTFRDIEVRRTGVKNFHADLYDLLTKGDRTWDIALADGDTVWIKQRGTQVRLAGAIKKPAYYELDSKTQLGTLLGWAGLIGSSFSESITLERVRSGEGRSIVTVPKESWARSQGILVDGDRIEVSKVSNLLENPIDLKGNIERPGRYQWYDGMRAADLIKLGGRLLDSTDMTRVDVRRKINGQAASFQFSGAAQRSTQESQLLSFNLAAALEKTPKENIFLRPHDEIIIYSTRAFRPAPEVSINGEVYKPGKCELRAGMRVSDLIYHGGGLKPEANLASAEIMRRKFVGFDNDQAYTTVAIPIDLRPILQGDQSNDPLLENYDVLRIDKVPNFSVKVQIEGDVRAPGEYVLPRGARLSDLLERCGGYLDEAYPRGARFYRQRVRIKQEEAKKRFVAAQKSQLSAKLADSLSETEYKSKRYGLQIANYKHMLNELSKTPAQGRLVVQIDIPSSELQQSDYNLVLEEGDKLVIPTRPSEISVEGFVFNNVSLVWEEGLYLGDYIKKSGGLKEGADPENLFVFRADGTAVNASKRGLNPNGKRRIRPLRKLVSVATGSHGFPRTKIEPGDVIFVPPHYDLKDDWDLARGVVDIVFKSAISTGIIASIGL